MLVYKYCLLFTGTLLNKKQQSTEFTTTLKQPTDIININNNIINKLILHTCTSFLIL